MNVRRTVLQRRTTADMDVIDLTGDVQAFVAESGVMDGLLLVFTPGSTAGVTTIEYESGAVADLKRVMDELVPRGATYRHDQRWGDGNGYSHVRSALLGPSLVVPVAGGRPVLGTWQQIVLCDFDNRPRHREVVVQVSGLGAT